MKKILLAIILLFAFQFSANAQNTSYRVYTRLTLPTNCSKTSSSTDEVIIFATSDQYICKDPLAVYPANWQLVGGGSDLSGSGVNTRVAFWNGTKSLTSDSGFTFDSINKDLTIGRDINIGRQFVGQFGTFTPLSDISTLYLRRFSSTQASPILLFQTEGNVQLSFIDKSGVFNGNVIGNITGVASGNATLALDNLASVNINSAFLFQTGIDIGSTTKPARDLYLFGSGTYGTNYFRLTGTPTSTRIVTIPDLADYTLAQITNGQTFNGNQTFVNNILASVDGTPNIGAIASNRFNIFPYSLSMNGAASVPGEFKFGTGSNAERIASGFHQFANGIELCFASGDPGSNACDSGITRNGINILEINSGTVGTYRDLIARTYIGGSSTTAPLLLQTTTGVGTTGSDIIFKGGNNGATEFGRILNAGNFKWAGTAVRATTEGTNHIDIFNGTAPVGTLTNGISLYTTAGELRVMDSAGNATLLSPHDREGNWIHDEVNYKGRKLHVDMERLVLDLDKALGGGYVKFNDRYTKYSSAALIVSNNVNPFSNFILGSISSLLASSQNIGGTQVIAATPGTTVTLAIDATAKEIVASETAAQNQTIVISGTPQDGTRMTIIITNDASLVRTITMGSGISASATIVGTLSKKATISFVALNGTFIETSRTLGI